MAFAHGMKERELTRLLTHAPPDRRADRVAFGLGLGVLRLGFQSCLDEDVFRLIVMLDNDVYFDAPGAVAAAVAAFHRLPQAGCISFRVYHPQLQTLHARDWCHSRPWPEAEFQEFETHYVTEGACAFRREVFETVEGYWEDLWIGHEGFDLSLRILDAGWEMWYTPDVKVWHLASLETRDTWRPYYFNTRNLLLVAMRDYPWHKAPSLLLPRLGVLAFYAARYGYLRHYCKAIADGIPRNSTILTL